MFYSSKLWSDERDLLIQLLQNVKNNVINCEEKQPFDEILTILTQTQMPDNEEHACCDLCCIDGHNLLCESVLACSDSPLAENLLRKLIYHSQLFIAHVS